MFICSLYSYTHRFALPLSYMLMHVSALFMIIALMWHESTLALNSHQLSLSSGLDHLPNAGVEQDPGEAGPSSYQQQRHLEVTLSCLVIAMLCNSLWHVLFSWV